MNPYYVPSIILGTETLGINKRDKVFAFKKVKCESINSINRAYKAMMIAMGNNITG